MRCQRKFYTYCNEFDWIGRSARINKTAIVIFGNVVQPKSYEYSKVYASSEAEYRKRFKNILKADYKEHRPRRNSLFYTRPRK